MEQTMKLNLTEEWEDIVNKTERHNARVNFEKYREKRKLHKQINKALCYATGAAGAVMLERTGLLALKVAVPAAMVLVCMACFVAGQVASKWKVYYGQ